MIKEDDYGCRNMKLRNMKMKKTIIVLCCVIIAAMGIVLTGCGNGSGDKNAESNTEKYVESNSDKSMGSNSDKDTESNTEKNTENNVVKSTESNSVKDAENLYVGTWESKIAEYDGNEYDVKEIIGVYEVTFNADGTYSLLQEGYTTSGKWEPVEEGVKVIEKSGYEYCLTYKDEKLIMDIVIGEISVTYYFEKKK